MLQLHTVCAESSETITPDVQVLLYIYPGHSFPREIASIPKHHATAEEVRNLRTEIHLLHSQSWHRKNWSPFLRGTAPVIPWIQKGPQDRSECGDEHRNVCPPSKWISCFPTSNQVCCFLVISGTWICCFTTSSIL